MTAYVQVAVNVPQVSGVFDYHLPPELEGRVTAGHLVEVPFGKQQVQGVVLQPVAAPAVEQTRAVLALLDPLPALTAAQLALAQEMAASTLSTLAAWVDLMLPPGLGQQADILWEVGSGKREVEGGQRSAVAGRPSATATRLTELLHARGPLRGRQIDASLPHVDWRPAARALEKQGVLASQPVLPSPTARAKSVKTVQLGCRPEDAEAAMSTLGRAGSAALARRQAMLRFLLREPEPVDVSWVYAESGGGGLADLQHLAERGLVVLGESEVWRDPLAGLGAPPYSAPPLTREQQTLAAEIETGLRAARQGETLPPWLLHGVTGSGKTEIYLRAVEETLRAGQQAIVLVPEIALTPQTVRRFVGRFPGQVGLAHSALSPGERYDTWRRARAGLISVVVGPRSALFTPFGRLGLVVVDEFHDDSYYQSEAPFYHAADAAVKLARLAGAACLMGSATPDVGSMYRARRGEWRLIELPQRILAHRQTVQAQVQRLGLSSRYRPLEEQAETMALPPVRVVDMREELKDGNTSIFSRALQAALREVLEKGQQAILFLNRRGAATFVFCRACGHNLKCPQCDLPLTLHVERSTDRLLCHHCGYTRKMPEKCPACGSDKIRQYGAGVEKVEAEVQALFPAARTLRWDADATRQKGAHEIILSHFANHRADLLIGTQMIAKGLDLPLVTLVGAVLADVGLNMPDYRAAERGFHVLTQVAGRAGRSPLGGEVIFQTFQPEHYVIQAAARHDYAAFYRQELEYRKQLGYPPFARLARLEYRHRDEFRAQAAAQEMAAKLRGWLAAEDRRATDLIGPAPCYFSKVAGLHRWQIIVRGPDPTALLRGKPLGEWRVEPDPASLL